MRKNEQTKLVLDIEGLSSTELNGRKIVAILTEQVKSKKILSIYRSHFLYKKEYFLCYLRKQIIFCKRETI